MYLIATWRLSILLTQEEGPGMVFTRVRELLGAEVDGYRQPWETIPWYAKLMQCPYCISIWIAFFFFLLGIANRKLFLALIISLSGSGATALIEDFKNG